MKRALGSYAWCGCVCAYCRRRGWRRKLRPFTRLRCLCRSQRLPVKLSAPVFGQKIAFYDIGSGPVVVLVHGFGSEARFDWGNVILPSG